MLSLVKLGRNLLNDPDYNKYKNVNSAVTEVVERQDQILTTAAVRR